MGSQPSIQSSMKNTGNLANSLVDMFAQLVDHVLGRKSVEQRGKPWREVFYMHLPMGFPIDPRDYSNPWTPAGGDTLADFSNSGTLNPAPATGSGQPGASGTSTATKSPPKPDPQLQHSLDSARKTAVRFDRMLRVTSDGTYRPYESGETVSSAYEGIIRKAQGIPAPDPPTELQDKINAARTVLWNLSANRNVKGKTDNYKQYEKLSQAWAAVRQAFCNADANTQTYPTAASAWPGTSSTLQM